MFYSHRQMQETGDDAVRARPNQPQAMPARRQRDPAARSESAVTRIRTFEGALAESLARERLSALVSGGFALSGLLLASLGLYGLLAFLVAERTKEIGLRIALGAQRGSLTWSVVGGGLRLVGIGAAIGVGMSLLLLPWFGTLLFGVTPNDLPTYAIVLTLLLAVAGLASYVPARRAARIEPMIALRQD